MFLLSTFLDSLGQPREFHCCLPKLEDSLTAISKLVANGNVLIDIRLTSEGSVMLLPVEVFDGESFSEIIGQLEDEWHTILMKPRIESKNSEFQLLNSFDERYLTTYQNLIKDLQLLIQQIENLLIWTSQHEGVSERIDRLHLRHKSALMLYQKQLVRAYLVQDRVQHRVKKYGY